MFPYYKINKRTKKKKCFIYKRTDGSEKELNLKVHRSFLFFRFFNSNIPESISPLVSTNLSHHEMRIVYKCVLYSYLSYKDRTRVIFPQEIKIEHESFESDVRRIPFFIVTDSTINSIIVSCRGSSCKEDFITDSLGNGISYGDGKFHEGIFSTASYIFMACQNKLLELNSLYNGDEDSISETTDESSSSSDSYEKCSDYSSGSSDSEEETEYEEDDDDNDKNSNDNKKSIHKSTSNDKLHRLSSQGSIRLQRSASSEDLHLFFNSKNPKKQEENSKPKQINGTNQMPESFESSNLFNSVSFESSTQREKESNEIKKRKDHENSTKQSYSVPSFPPQKVRKSTSSDNLNECMTTGKISIQRSASRDNLHLQFKTSNNCLLASDSESSRNDDDESSKTDFDTIFMNKMRRKRTKIIITGHSLGASVAAVVAYLFKEKFPQLNVHCYAFAPPPTLTFGIWKNTGKYVKSFMVEGDVVPFLSVRNLMAISDIIFTHEFSNRKFKKFIISYLEEKSLEEFDVDNALSEKFYPPGQQYLIRFTNNSEGGLFSFSKKSKKKKNKEDPIDLCQILNPDYFSNIVKNIQENNHAVKNYMRLIIRLMNKFRKPKNNCDK